MRYQKRTNLCGKWLLTDDENNVHNAIVPGCVHTDIVKENMYWRDNSDKIRDIENHEWEYTRDFQIDKIESNAYIVFEGLDTYCDIFLNGIKIGSGSNMFISQRFNADKAIKTGINTLKVHFYSPIKISETMPKRFGAFTSERLNTRRIQCTYGWDWTARFVTCGIFRPVYLVFDNQFEVDNIYIFTETIDNYGAYIRILGNTVNYDQGQDVTVKIISPKGNIIYEKREFINSEYFEECVNISEPQLWSPNGYGEQPLYTLRLEYGDKYDEEKFGIRTARVVEIEDTLGSENYRLCKELQKTPSGEVYDKNEKFSSFFLYVNGIKIMCKGANYVPTEPFISEEKDEKITKVLEMAKNAGVNMIRIWGGGIFEKGHFYNECDRLGIMVTQDMLMACGMYPEDEWFINELLKETEYAAKKLRNHPCLMWWNGDNENAVNGTYTDKNYPGKKAFFSGILPALIKFDPTRRAFASSPYGGNKFASKTTGTTHNTQYLSMLFDYIVNSDMSDYKETLETYTARFIAEEPALGLVGMNSLREMMTEEDIHDPEMKMFYHHTKTNPSLPYELLDYTLMFAEKVFGQFENNEDKLFKLRYVQYEWIRVTLENARRRHGFCDGIIYWMLNDCWPAASGWAFIDYYCRPKASYYSFKRAAKKLVSSVTCKDGKYTVTLSNNGTEKIHADISCSKINILSGEESPIAKIKTVIPKNENSIYDFDAKLEETDIFVCDIDNGETDRSFHKAGNLKLKKCDKIKITKITPTEVELETTSYVHVVELDGEAVFEDNFFSMKKNEKKTVKYSGNGDITVSAYTLK